eukprot:8385-Heterococcus_DN1.PRE.1
MMKLPKACPYAAAPERSSLSALLATLYTVKCSSVASFAYLFSLRQWCRRSSSSFRSTADISQHGALTLSCVQRLWCVTNQILTIIEGVTQSVTEVADVRVAAAVECA